MPFLTLPGPIDPLALHAVWPERYPYLLQTLGGHPGWDILLAHPQGTLRKGLGQPLGFLSTFDEAWQRASATASHEPNTCWLPFHGGWFLYLGYELLQEIEPRVTARSDGASFPIAYAARVPAAVMVDRIHGVTYLYSESTHAELLESMRRDILQTPRVPSLPPVDAEVVEDDPQSFLDGVARIQRYIREGDVFQVNLARRWHGSIRGSAVALYERLSRTNPAPYGGLADFGDCQVVSSSPERLVQIVQGTVQTRPIAGTRPRATDPERDVQLKAQLLATAKERAEHIMLVDLERNDLGRICRPGSVTVPQLLEVTSYAYVHHLESTVRGTLRAGVTPGAVIRALFPGGTITGCPKVRCMQIIRELETHPRLAYTGGMGYVNHDGSMDLNILIRSLIVEAGGRFAFWAGAGVVADSDPRRELAETRAKAEGLLRALEGAHG